MRELNSYKVVLLGDSGVGKSSLLLQFVEDDVSHNIKSTIGIDYRKSKLTVGNEEITLDIWDTAGQERYRSITQSHFRDAQGVVLMYSVDNPQSYLSVSHWQSEISRLCPPEVRVLILGNKCDIAERSVPVETGLKMSGSLGIPFMESSAKNNVNVRTTFHLLARMMVDERKANEKKHKMDTLMELKTTIQIQQSDCCQRSIENTCGNCSTT